MVFLHGFRALLVNNKLFPGRKKIGLCGCSSRGSLDDFF